MDGVCKICSYRPRNCCISETVKYSATVTVTADVVSFAGLPLSGKSGNVGNSVLTGLSGNFAV